MVSSKKSMNRGPMGRLSGVLDRLWTSFEDWIPFGYQNETGFHHGIDFISLLLDPPSENHTDPLPF